MVLDLHVITDEERYDYVAVGGRYMAQSAKMLYHPVSIVAREPQDMLVDLDNEMQEIIS